MVTPSPSRKVAESALAIMSACNAAAAGFDLCARRTQDRTVAVAARSAAVFLHSIRAGAIELAFAAGVEVHPRSRTGDRLRWEWLASTATVLDGAPDRRLTRECARILSETEATCAMELLSDAIGARFRLALAEACSLAFAIDRMQSRPLAIALG